MPMRPFELAVVTDEVSRNVAAALEVSEGWGLSRFELREGGQQRFPFFTPEEWHAVEEALRRGARVTAVSPGLLKGSVEDEARLARELDEVLPQALEAAARFEVPRLVLFGFERVADEPERNRVRVLRAFERAAEQAAAAGLEVALENEPGFWIDDPEGSVALLAELDHPGVKLNWDPANLHWGGRRPEYEGFCVVLPYLAGLHVKDFSPQDPAPPWRPVGQGATPWPEILRWVIAESDLPHATLETHCEPLYASSRASLDWLQEELERIRTELA